MPAACSFSGRLSTRKASTTMSCVAEAVATISAPSAIIAGAATGSHDAEQDDRRDQRNCVNISQPRRRPSQRDRIGTSKASMIGAHRNLKV